MLMPALTRKNAPNYADRVNLIKKIKLDEAAALRPLSLKPMEGSRTRCGSTVLEHPTLLVCTARAMDIVLVFSNPASAKSFLAASNIRSRTNEVIKFFGQRGRSHV
jgi:hypothetical protein